MIDAIQLYKTGRFFLEIRMKRLSRFFDRLNYYLHNSVIPSTCELGKGTRFAYGGIGVVIHAHAKVGENCIIGQGTTIGTKMRGDGGVPVIQDNVYLGTGSKILGNIVVGHDVIVGANAVVVYDVEPFCVVGGVPARVLKNERTRKKSADRYMDSS